MEKILGCSLCLSGKVNIRQGALQPQMGTEPNTVIVSYQNSINLRFCQCRFCTCVERNPRNQLDTRNQAIHLHDIHCKPYGERNICTRKPSDATCVRGKACNMILAMHSTCLQKTSSYRYRNYVVTPNFKICIFLKDLLCSLMEIFNSKMRKCPPGTCSANV